MGSPGISGTGGHSLECPLSFAMQVWQPKAGRQLEEQGPCCAALLEVVVPGQAASAAAAHSLEEGRARAGPGCPASSESPKAQQEPLAGQDFLRIIPSELLGTDLYEDWMAAVEKSSRKEKVEELKA
ncbi:t-cell activation rho gtpase-activating [Limosa lapponica baueri]|uniref:T-cell activation rho gtpase-activating n=1 Tax=Limosa lapponica baueri TaxID=1758121 RepID=A0A2I0TFG1_LIMLA|nr:t-cell activation rho gtpase-activating [Limosa lapponica baueri]